MEYVTRGVCGQEGCREIRYYLDNGLWFCRRGHLQEGRQIEEDPDDFGTQGKKHRVKKETTEKSKKTYHGRQAYTLFLQVYQLILWKQCHALVHDHGFPEPFDAVVRDLWALRLQDFSLRIDESTEDEHEDPELFSSQPTDKDEFDEMGFKPGSKYLEWPRLLDSVALCYLAALLMRLPICVSDFYRMIIRQDVPYIRALTIVPREMRDKLPPELVSILDVNKLPKAEHLHRGVLEISLFYQRRFGLAIPPLNSPLVLYRIIKRLAIPVEVYEAIKKLQELLAFTYEYPTRLRGNFRRSPYHLPEVQLVVLTVIATKLFFPLDDLKRYPATNREPGAQFMDWSVWERAQRHFNNHERVGGKIGKDHVVQLTDKDVLTMTPDQLDEYMDWYESSWLDTPRVLNRVADMFPINRPEAEAQSNPPAASTAAATSDTDEALQALLQSVMQDLKPKRVILEEDETDVPRPGAWYRRYRWESQLAGPARAFYELAAELAAVSLPTLIRAVTVGEFRIARWLENQRRAEYLDNEMDMDMGDALDEVDGQLSELGVDEDR
ncbi:hypothetical protein NUU61_009262 [Penicillium alfredii]|uniref:RRN7-type domain-containing protein n=1 Tax=Penicillium alfredii TaxID=1506179 RepID=A0A9W9EMP2_9EURO|nr:uncharacterized protein NUU61_009262 [Penicillium alfredii]KAJ5084683.1 hypothetical protein NUU61_009262 [Penicillium alfredii]